MFSQISDDYVDMAVLAEYKAAVDQHGKEFDNFTVFVEVLREEVEESCDEVVLMYAEMRKMTLNLDELKKRARNGIKELAQVLAVLKKYETQTEEESKLLISYEDMEKLR